MGKDTGISWCDHTFNPWWGCEKVSPACAACYAEIWDARFGGKESHWGQGSDRKTFGPKHWDEPLAWDRAAEKAGRKALVFSVSMGDWLEDREDLDPQRARLLELIEKTPNLVWLLLTKRPEAWRDCMERLALVAVSDGDCLAERWLAGEWPANVAIGFTGENQEWFDRRAEHAILIPARWHFLSAEPLLGPIDMAGYLGRPGWPGIEWVIVGGEACGPGFERRARPMYPGWARWLRDQCAAEGVPFFFKQWGDWAPSDIRPGIWGDFVGDGGQIGQYCLNHDGTWKQDIRYSGAPMAHVGKKRAGHELDGVVHQEFPGFWS